MKNCNRDTQPIAGPGAAQPGATSPENAQEGVAPVPPMEEIEREILELSKSGCDPGRLWRLRKIRDAERIREIDQVLAAARKHYQARQHVSDEMNDRMLKTFDAAIERPDLTVPDALFISRHRSKCLQRELNSLVAERERIQSKERTGVR